MIAQVIEATTQVIEPLDITIPSVTVGSDFNTRCASDVRRALRPFRTDADKDVCVELMLTRS